jgi:amino acid permease
LSLSRSTARFAKWSAVTVILLTFMLAGVLIRVPVYAPPLSQIELETVPISENMFKGMAIMGLSFGCSQNLFGEYTSTRDKRPNSWLLTCSVAIFMSFVANIIFAVLCYLCFGSNVQANILLNFPESDPAIRLVRLALGLLMVLTIP